MTVTEDRELLARFEAHLRGWAIDDSYHYIEWPHGDVLTNIGSGGAGHHELTPHDTPAGREWWCEALRLDVVYDVHEGGWRVDNWAGNYSQSHFHQFSRSEAISSAILAAAKAWQETQR